MYGASEAGDPQDVARILQAPSAQAPAIKMRSLRRQMGLVTQETRLFDDTIFNNIAHGNRHAPQEQVLEAIRRASPASRPRMRRPISPSLAMSTPAGTPTSGLRDCSSVSRRV